MKKIAMLILIALLVGQVAFFVGYSVDSKTHKALKPKSIKTHFVAKKPDKPNNGHGKPSGDSGDGSGGGTNDASGDKFAVVIGISDYDGTSNDLRYADDDAVDWANYLKSLGYQVKLLLDREATAQAIEDAINWLLSVEDEPGDYVVFAYSGHGYHDATYGSMVISTDMVGITEGYFNDAFSQLDSQHAFFFFDACQIGGMSVLADTEVGRFVAMASNEHSYSYDGTSDIQNGYFTYYFLEDAIISKGYVYMEDAFDYATQMCKSIIKQFKPTSADTFAGGLAL
ncbi:MAG: caspase domain-containing protein [Candidatus Njordarchaeota archaeon]